MRLNVKAMGLALGLLWGAAMLIVGLANMVWEGYAQAFVDLMASVYPGYHGTASLWQVSVATLYGLVDGAIGGAVLAWVYNLFVPRAASA